MDHVVRVAAFWQQLVAARLAGVALAFSTFGTPDGCDALLAALRARPGAVSVARAWRLLLEHRARATVEASLVRALGGAGGAGAPSGGGARSCGVGLVAVAGVAAAGVAYASMADAVSDIVSSMSALSSIP